MPDQLINSTVPSNDKFIDEKGLVARVWLNFFLWLRQMISNILAGPFRVEQSQIVQTGLGLGFGDVGFLIWVQDYDHGLMWQGDEWTFSGVGERSGYIVTFLTAGPSPALGWHACDGSTVSFLRPDGTLGSQVLPVTPGDWFRQ